MTDTTCPICHLPSARHVDPGGPVSAPLSVCNKTPLAGGLFDSPHHRSIPTARAAAAFCAGTPDLWEYAFWDDQKLRWVSWIEIEDLIEKLNNSGLARAELHWSF